MQLWVFYQDYYQRIPIHVEEGLRRTIGPELIDDLTIQHFPFLNGKIVIEREGEDFKVRDGAQEVGCLAVDKSFSVKQEGYTLHLYLTPSYQEERQYYIGATKSISFGERRDDVTVQQLASTHSEQAAGHFSLHRTPTGWSLLKNYECPLFINGEKCERSATLEIGDILQWGFMEIELTELDILTVFSVSPLQSKLPLFAAPESEMETMYPDYKRTPRMIYELPADKVSLSFPAQESEDTSRGLWLIIAPPLVMLVVMGLVALLIPRGIFILISISMFTMTLVTSTVQYIKDKKRRKWNEAKRRRVYTTYLRDMRQQLFELSEKQKKVLRYHYPTFEQMKAMTESLSHRIWERSIDSHDFLEFRLGTGSVPASYEISLSSGDIANREVDDLLEQSQRMEKVYKEIPSAPLIVRLSDAIVGLIGKETVMKREIHQIIGQLAFFHSYHDVRFIYIFPEEEYEEVEWMKWLPHFTLPGMHAKGFIHNAQTRDQLLGTLYEMIRERDVNEMKGKAAFSPHLVFVISNYELIAEHVILEYLEGTQLSKLGISVLFAETAQERMTENVHTLIRYVNEHEGDMLIESKKAIEKPFLLDAHEIATNERFARRLKSLNHQMGVTNSIPDSVSFLQMIGVEDVDDLPIQHYWEVNESAKSLAVPIGLKGKDELVHLNLHEKAHGPHGLLAGTTGSGKSEFLQTYILSLAVHFHPHEVGFLLIDYKGGGMAQPFRTIPHLLGTITNIEGSKNFSMRALASINSELKRRQRLFDRYTVTHIDDYTTLYKKGKAEEPLPHLFLISDEFAELKSEEPEFIRELVSTARIGRSLGVHLILATQKPGGIIDDQIWSNTRFRVALKVQDASDSKEILKNSDAASITVTGRGYLQVGNNEVYELFQSAWSGAPYQEAVLESEDEVALITDLGWYPLSNIQSDVTRQSSGITEIEAVTNLISNTQAKLGIHKLASPWLPPLPLRLEKPRKGSNVNDVPMGLKDEPEKQSQTSIFYEPIKDGNVGVFGSSGYGKSYTLLTLLLGIGERFSPEAVHFYIFDYGNGALLPLRQAPHTADYFTIDEALKRDKLVNMLKDEMSSRKLAFQRAEVSHIQMYNRVSTARLPLLYVIVDNYDIVREEMEEFELQLTQFARDGQSLGIYVLISSTRVQVVRQSMLNNFKTKIVHYLMDPSEAFTVIGRVPFELEPFPGRAVFKKDEPAFVQMYLPADGEDDFEVLEGIKAQIAAWKQQYKQVALPEPIPMLPLELTSVHFLQYVHPKEQGRIPIGLDEETVRPVALDFTTNRHCLLIGPPQRGKTNLLKWVLNEFLTQQVEAIAVFDSFDRGLAEFASHSQIDYVETKEQLLEWITKIETVYREKEQAYLTQLQQGQSFSTNPTYFIIDGYTRFLQVADIGIQDRLSKLMKHYAHLGFNVLVAGNNAEMTKGYDAFTNELKQVRQALLFMKKSEQTVFTIAYERKEAELPLGFAHYVLNGNATRVQTPLCTIERKIMQ